MSLRQNDQELASMYDQVFTWLWFSTTFTLFLCTVQNHMDNHKSSMVGQMVVAGLAQGDKISVRLSHHTTWKEGKLSPFSFRFTSTPRPPHQTRRATISHSSMECSSDQTSSCSKIYLQFLKQAFVLRSSDQWCHQFLYCYCYQSLALVLFCGCNFKGRGLRGEGREGLLQLQL